MLAQSNPFTALGLISWIVWNIPSRRPIKMAEFSHTEAGSSLDMMDAAEETPSAHLRKKFFRHALDEFRHSRLFAERSLALSSDNHAATVLEDAEFAASHGIRGEASLYSRLGETEFLAFVWLHEQQGARQFAIYSDLMKQDAVSSGMFAEICSDEKFHVDYSRQELDGVTARANGASEVKAAIRRLRLRGFRESFLRMSRSFGDIMASLWLLLIYLLVIGPFSLLAKAPTETERFIRTPGSLTRARAEAGIQG